jgi:hypothetical protein
MQFLSKQGRPLSLYEVSEGDELMSLVIIYVDDGGIIVTPDAFKEMITALRNTFKVKSIGKMDMFIGCHIIDKPDKDGAWNHQPKLLKN